ncbi:hypothetical protein [Chromobacterium haemolyticum]|uniref:hypothetical protein n=1 Tax=Chromobacterium haemolyticum TaxID=394935 RepID=UPI0011B260BD|nr:hypothetical protein [Chromobacterium haemolyticum]QOD83511.1 hypothetical protein IEZ30_03210 [Chromobacterium haemolyticum]
MTAGCFELSPEDVAFWREKVRGYSSMSRLLRDLVGKYKVSRNDAGVMLYDIVDGFSLNDISYVWKWDIDGNGQGISDDRLDKYLEHLLQN